MSSLFDINTVFFTILDYPMSYIEFFGTVFNLWCVWLVAKNRILNWPIGLVGVVLFAYLYLQIHLYADFLEQIYFFVTGIWGWYIWATVGKKEEGELPVSYTNTHWKMWSLFGITMGTVLMGFLVARLHIFFPAFFTEPASYPYLDACTTVLSFTATILMVYRKVESWYLWILVDVIGVWLYWAKGVSLVSLLYLVFLGIAIHGLMRWVDVYRHQQNTR